MPRLDRRLVRACFVIHHYSGGNRVFDLVWQCAVFITALWSRTTMLVAGPRVPGVVARRIGGRCG